MAEKILKTRIQLRYDTLANWTTNDPVLKKGELAVATIDVAAPANKQLPPVMFKVGDGTSKFSQLEWASALAADVYDWAKKTGIEVNTSGTGAVVTGIAWDATNKRLNVTKGNVDLSGYVPTSRTIAGVDLKDNVTKAELLTALNVADGATKVVETTVSGWGFTKNAGTVTGITMNGAAKSVGTDGVVDLGTVITSHQDISGKQDKAINIENIAAKTVEGALTEINTAADDAQQRADEAYSLAEGKYSKPTGGIPKTDLASAVQTSLGKADTALQSHQTVTLASGTNNGTLKLTVGGTATDNIAVKGLGSAAYTASSAYATAAQGTKADNAMPKAGGAFTGAVTVQAPTADMNPATKQYVDNAISAVHQFQYEVVSTLPTASASTMGKIYLVADAHGTQDSYDEFITLESGTTTKTYTWEKIGNTDIDLTDYVKTLSGTANSGVITNLTKSGNTLTVTSTSLAVSAPTASGTALAFIDSISQAANGKITATKKTVSDATESAHGLMAAADKTKLNGIEAGAQKNVNSFGIVHASDEGTITASKPGDEFGFDPGELITVGYTAESEAFGKPAVSFNHSVPTGAAAKTSGLYKIATDKFGHVTGTTVVTKSDITGLGIPAENTNTAHTHTNGVGLVRTGDGGTSGTVNYKVALANETLDANAAVSRPAANANRTYPVIADKNGKLATIVPWTDNNTVTTVSTTADDGLKVTKTNNDYKVDIDTEITFVFDCGDSAD